MSFEKLGFFPSKKQESLPVPTPEELAFMEKPWYHGSPKQNLETLLPNGGKLFGYDDGVHISLDKELPRSYGNYISEWKLKGPLKIISLNEIGSVNKKLLKEAGYIGFYWIDIDGTGSGVVWNGNDLEKVDETSIKN